MANINSKKEKLLKLISHITENEASYQVVKGSFCIQLLKSQDEQYLYLPFHPMNDYANGNDVNDGNNNSYATSKQGKKNSQAYRKKNIYLSDRINE